MFQCFSFLCLTNYKRNSELDQVISRLTTNVFYKYIWVLILDMFILSFHLLHSLIFSMLQSQLKTLIKSYWTSFQYHYSIITQFRYPRLLIFQFSSFSSAQSPVPYLINSNQCWNCNTICLLHIRCNFFSSIWNLLKFVYFYSLADAFSASYRSMFKTFAL